MPPWRPWVRDWMLAPIDRSLLNNCSSWPHSTCMSSQPIIYHGLKFPLKKINLSCFSPSWSWDRKLYTKVCVKFAFDCSIDSFNHLWFLGGLWLDIYKYISCTNFHAFNFRTKISDTSETGLSKLMWPCTCAINLWLIDWVCTFLCRCLRDNNVT